MSLSDLTQKITTDADEARAAILRNADSRCSKIIEEYDEKKRVLKDTFRQETAAILEKNIAKVTLGAEREAKLLVDRVKREELDKAFRKTYEQLLSLDDSSYQHIITPFVESLPKDDAKLVIKTSAQRAELTKKVAERAQVHCSIQEDSAIAGGFVAIGDNYEYDFRFEKLIQEKEKQYEVEVAQILFS